MTLDFAGDGLTSITVDEGTINALVENKQLIKADGGVVIMTAKAADMLIQAVVNNEGILEAKTVENQRGTIVLLADMDNGITTVSGTLDASASEEGDGGFIETSGKTVEISDGTTITTVAPNGETGTWLIDPTNFTIDGSNASVLSSILSTTNITLETQEDGTDTGDIHINAALSWTANTALKLSAHNDIHINADIQASAGTLKLYYGQAIGDGGSSSYTLSNGAQVNLSAGNHFYTKKGSAGSEVAWKVITALGVAGAATGTDLEGMNGNLSGYYVLGADVDASDTSGWNSGAGFDPIGDDTTAFTGGFDGLGHTISNLTIQRSATDYVGLFGYVNAVSIANVGLVNASIAGKDYVGALVGHQASGNMTIHHGYVTGSVTGSRWVGGMVGYFGSGSLASSYATATVNGGDDAGGLAGCNASGTIRESYATGAVSGNTRIGGLVGDNAAGTVSNSYATGSVSGTSNVGGLAGSNVSGSLSGSFWDTATTGQSAGCGIGDCSGATGLSTAQMQMYATFSSAGWSVSAVGGASSLWRIYDGLTYPLLGSFLTDLTITSHGGSRVYDGTTDALGITYSLTPDGGLLAGTLDEGSTSSKHVGTYTVTASGLYAASQQGYDIQYVSGTVTITAATLSVGGSSSASDKVYDGTTAASITGGAISGMVSGDDVSLSQSGTFSDKNVGVNKTVSYANSLSGADAGNYVLDASGGTTSASITAATVNVSTTAGDKTYDGTTAVSLSALVSGIVNGDAVTFSQSGSFDDENVGAGKTVSYTNLLSGSDASNYVLSVVTDSTTASITPASLTVTARDDSKSYDGQAYGGGNGVRYSGFVAGEDASVLSGTLVYGGSSQGATNVGSYSITASGLSGQNYTIHYVDGILTIQPSNTYKTVLSIIASQMNALFSQSGGDVGEHAGGGVAVRMMSDMSLIDAGLQQVIEGGIRLPPELLPGEGGGVMIESGQEK